MCLSIAWPSRYSCRRLAESCFASFRYTLLPSPCINVPIDIEICPPAVGADLETFRVFGITHRFGTEVTSHLQLGKEYNMEQFGSYMRVCCLLLVCTHPHDNLHRKFAAHLVQCWSLFHTYILPLILLNSLPKFIEVFPPIAGMRHRWIQHWVLQIRIHLRRSIHHSHHSHPPYNGMSNNARLLS